MSDIPQDIMRERAAADKRLIRQQRRRIGLTKIVPTKGSKLVRRFFELLNEERVTMAAVSRVSGVGESTMYRWRESYEPTLGNFEACLNAMGYELMIREKK